MNWKQKTQMKTTKQNSKRESNSTIELAFMRLLVAVLKTALLIVATVTTAQAEPRQHKHNRSYTRHESHNYIIERQEAGLVSGVPTTRRVKIANFDTDEQEADARVSHDEEFVIDRVRVILPKFGSTSISLQGTLEVLPNVPKQVNLRCVTFKGLADQCSIIAVQVSDFKFS